VIGRVGLISVEQAEQAMQAARAAFPNWRRTPATERAGVAESSPVDGKTPSRISQLDCLEVGKAVREADSEVSEAIDCRYYASEMERLDQGITTTTGETNRYHYQPRGCCGDFSWNFPLAIATGMTVAALVGNCTLLKLRHLV